MSLLTNSGTQRTRTLYSYHHSIGGELGRLTSLMICSPGFRLRWRLKVEDGSGAIVCDQSFSLYF
jgi:hypothetical protein